MNANNFVELNKRLGHSVKVVGDYSWLVRKNATALSLPSLEDIYPTINNVKQLRKEVRTAIFKTNIEKKNSYEFIFEGNSYDISEFSSKVRNQIRKGLKSCFIKKPSLVDLLERGLFLNRETLKRHKRGVKYLQDESQWCSYIGVLYEEPDVIIRGAYHEDKLIGYVIFILVNNKYYIYHPFMDKEYSSYYPMNTILFEFINEIIKKDGCIYISYGLSSFLEKEGLDHFKKGMLFKQIECTRVLIMNRFLDFIVNGFTLKVVKIFRDMKLLSDTVYSKFLYLHEGKKGLIEYIKYYSK